MITYQIYLLKKLTLLLNSHKIQVEYYTNDSNIIALVSSLLFIILYRKKKEFVKDLRFLSTIIKYYYFLHLIIINIDFS